MFESHEDEGEPFVRDVKRLDPSGVVVVETALGRDFVMSALDIGTLEVQTSGGSERIIDANFTALRDPELFSAQLPDLHRIGRITLRERVACLQFLQQPPRPATFVGVHPRNTTAPGGLFRGPVLG